MSLGAKTTVAEPERLGKPSATSAGDAEQDRRNHRSSASTSASRTGERSLWPKASSKRERVARTCVRSSSLFRRRNTPRTSSRSFARPARIFVTTRSSGLISGISRSSIFVHRTRSKNNSSRPGPASTTSKGSRGQSRQELNGGVLVRHGVDLRKPGRVRRGRGAAAPRPANQAEPPGHTAIVRRPRREPRLG